MENDLSIRNVMNFMWFVKHYVVIVIPYALLLDWKMLFTLYTYS